MARIASTELPTGTVSFLFTDIEGSTRLVQAIGDRYPTVLEEHARLIRAAIQEHAGVEVSTEGDAFFVVFASAADAVAAATDAQRALAAFSWPDGIAVKVRMGIHTGDGRLGGDNYAGVDVHRAARIAAAGHGGQVLTSAATRSMVAAALPDGVAVRELGRHRLKDLEQPEHLFDLAISGLPDRFPPLRAVDLRLAGMPANLTSFVGREAELDEVSALLDDARLLTLVGPGGTGKTRLSVELARRRLGAFPDGAVFVALDAIRDPGLVGSAIAQALGVREEGRPAEDALAAHVATKRLLLVLDNFEQVLPAAALVEDLLRVAPELRILVTSRVPLRIAGEQEYPVAPLTLPETSGPTLETLLQFEAVALFLQRARAVSPSFEIDPMNADAIVGICRRLDGLPLAIELAAARVKLLSPQAILERLDRRTDLLANRSGPVPERQRTLRGAIDWSWELLSEDEQRLFERLSIFAGGWDLAAAEAVCGVAPLETDLMDGLATLLDNSLIRRGDAEEPRFTMLQTIGGYARERLAERGELEDIASRHGAYFRDLAEAAEPELVGRDPARGVARILPEQDNMRAALAWALEADDADVGVRLAGAVWRFWQERGLLREGRAWLERLLALPSTAGSSPLRARALTAVGGIAYWQGDRAARDYYEEVLAINRELGDAAGIADALQNLAFTVMTAETEEGIGIFRESLARYRELNDVRNIASVMGALGYAHMLLGQHDEARVAVEEALALNTTHGARNRANDNRFALGHLDRLAGDLAGAAAHYRTALVEARSMADATRMVMHLRGISGHLFAAGRQLDAVLLAGAVARATEEQGGTLSVPLPGLPDPVEEARASGSLTGAEIEQALGDGRGMDLAAAVELALSLLDGLPVVSDRPLDADDMADPSTVVPDH